MHQVRVHIILALLTVLSATMAAADPIPGAGGSVKAPALPASVYCAQLATDPAKCANVTVHSDKASLESAWAADVVDTVHYLDTTITITDSDGGLSLLTGTTLAIDQTLLCAPGVEIRWDPASEPATTAWVTKITNFNLSATGYKARVLGCTFIEYANGVPGGNGTRTVEGLKFALTTSGGNTGNDASVERLSDVRFNRAFVYSTGSSTTNCAFQSAMHWQVYAEGNYCYGAIGMDAKENCTGCETIAIHSVRNTYEANRAATDPRCMKIAEEARVVSVDDTFIGCYVDLNSPSDGKQHVFYRPTFREFGNADTSVGNRTAFRLVGATDHDLRVVDGTFYADDAAESLVDADSMGNLDITGTLVRCHLYANALIDGDGPGTNERWPSHLHVELDDPGHCDANYPLVSSAIDTALGALKTTGIVRVGSRYLTWTDGTRAPASGDGISLGAAGLDHVAVPSSVFTTSPLFFASFEGPGGCTFADPQTGGAPTVTTATACGDPRWAAHGRSSALFAGGSTGWLEYKSRWTTPATLGARLVFRYGGTPAAPIGIFRLMNGAADTTSRVTLQTSGVFTLVCPTTSKNSTLTATAGRSYILDLNVVPGSASAGSQSLTIREVSAAAAETVTCTTGDTPSATIDGVRFGTFTSDPQIDLFIDYVAVIGQAIP